MKSHYLLVATLGAGILAKATIDLRNIQLKRWYEYLKCINEKLNNGTNSKSQDIEDIRTECYSEVFLKYPMPPSVYIAGITFFLPISIAFLYEALSMTKEV